MDNHQAQSVTEKFFGAWAGWLILGEIMSTREVVGCVLMLIGMVVTQWKIIKRGL